MPGWLVCGSGIFCWMVGEDWLKSKGRILNFHKPSDKPFFTEFHSLGFQTKSHTVTQKIGIFLEKKKLILILTCAPISELPSSINNHDL